MQYRWGILATGKIAGKFAEALSTVEEAEKFAIASRSLQKAQQFASKYQFTRAYGSYEELLRDPEVDIVYIATPHHAHVQWSAEALQNNKHVLSEKPLGLSYSSVSDLLDFAQSSGNFFMEALWTRFIPSFKKAADWHASGKIGEIKTIIADFGFRASFDPQARLFNKSLGGGALLDIGIYPLFLAHHFLGKPDQILASSIFGETGIDESTQAILRYPNAIATIQCTLVASTPVEAHINGTAGSITIHGKWHEPTKSSLYDVNGNVTDTFSFSPICNGYEYEIMEVHQCLNQGRTESTLFPVASSRELFTLLQGVMVAAGISY